ncbi:hypothetical protein YW3DRAFT_07097 [Streptomyces sp. MnatMP-M77]|uniref:hypothetical protein n=1 Tax=unclassified Streptomyces TaxID=2593676 RepID=UPI0008059A7E|nr:hypothetical protein [Streptomyces sp. MnatMP-M77]SBV03693.1 hypothetical protein YW3DRAFT_07097 [Streptomyces sp. MnatMP-M77]
MKRPRYLWQGGSSARRRPAPVRPAADAFLGSISNPNTARNYGIGVGKAAERLGEARPLAAVPDDEVGEALELLWGTAAVTTWNARRAAVLSWLGWCAERGYDGPAVPAWVKRMTPPDSQTPARSKLAVDRLIARREVHLRDRRCGQCSTRPARGRKRSSE